jgi:hypothetical protein
MGVTDGLAVVSELSYRAPRPRPFSHRAQSVCATTIVSAILTRPRRLGAERGLTRPFAYYGPVISIRPGQVRPLIAYPFQIGRVSHFKEVQVEPIQSSQRTSSIYAFDQTHIE